MAVMDITSIRGATTIDADTAEDIKLRAVELMGAIVAYNGIDGKKRRIVNIMISSTPDITASYPAAAIRLSGVDSAALFSAAEPCIKGSLKMCIRLMVTVCDYEGDIKPTHVYLHGAKVLRPDLSADKGAH